MISLSHAAAITKAKILTLSPDFQKRVHDWFEECVKAGLVPYVYEGFRTIQRQKELYAIGRTSPGKIVTQADAGQSFHNYGLAIDWVPLQRVDKATDMYEAAWSDVNAYKHGQVLAEKYGMRALSWELPHLEDARFSDWRELKQRLG